MLPRTAHIRFFFDVGKVKLTVVILNRPHECAGGFCVAMHEDINGYIRRGMSMTVLPTGLCGGGRSMDSRGRLSLQDVRVICHLLTEMTDNILFSEICFKTLAKPWVLCYNLK